MRPPATGLTGWAEPTRMGSAKERHVAVLATERRLILLRPLGELAAVLPEEQHTIPFLGFPFLRECPDRQW